jgi:hypothetical protein
MQTKSPQTSTGACRQIEFRLIQLNIVSRRAVSSIHDSLIRASLPLRCAASISSSIFRSAPQLGARRTLLLSARSFSASASSCLGRLMPHKRWGSREFRARLRVARRTQARALPPGGDKPQWRCFFRPSCLEMPCTCGAWSFLEARRSMRWGRWSREFLRIEATASTGV